jgi:hypothetical protein
MSEDRCVDFVVVLEHLARIEIDHGRQTHEEVTMALSLVLAALIADIPSKAVRQGKIENIAKAITRDVEELVIERQSL